jgi:putative spermidine/putrescine transport system ATP-binding protein
MSKGRIEQLGSPVEIYDQPETLFVNDFIGSSNRFAGVVESAGEGAYGVRLASGALWQVASRKPFAPGDRVIATIRPEQLVLTDAVTAGTIPVTLKLSLPIGGELIHDVETGAGEAFKVAASRRPGEPVSPMAATHCALAPHARPVLFPQPAA